MNDFMAQLRKKHDLLLSVLELTGLQFELIQKDDTDSLLSNISKRQNLIDELDEIQAELPDRETLAQNGECMTLIATVNGILKKIQEQDRKNEQAALARMEQLRGEMRKMNGQRRTLGYEAGASADLSGTYIDKEK